MIRVRIFDQPTDSEINEWLESHSDIIVKDVKMMGYACSGSQYEKVMVIYEQIPTIRL